MDPMGLQAVLIGFHLDDDGVGEELSGILNFMMQFGEPDDLLQMCVNMKEEGNLLFKKNLYDEALSMYDKATKLLCFALIENEEQNSRFFDLAISLNLNLALCAFKLNLFAQGRELCSIVLNFYPANVKALYRRAL
ncbi:70 kDa peptidyl-prolyl isomerase-like [Chenopodium quinoa]|uniref:70 kDa peptidyl-prolyl isomerase-like n=1 Tax=Chenopodium quinoa TaxID=63459 RepID=UPI000B772CDE|nr:70 kDa peptidyl-prolyl isomerase-like [Chenopodium quinoa]